ncbi:MAG: hypothetical protein ACK4ON_07580, partial [Bacteroidia bacterium]
MNNLHASFNSRNPLNCGCFFMHILLVNNTRIPALKYGGTERVIWALGKALVALGHQVSYLVAKGSHCPFAMVYAYNPAITLERQIPEDVDLVHIHFPIASA